MSTYPQHKDSGVSWLGEIPAHWNVASLKRSVAIQTGLTLGKRYDGVLIERPYLRVANVQDGHLDLEDIATIEVPVAVAQRLELRSKDVLMTEGGDLDKLGRGFLWNGEIQGCLHQNHIFALRCALHRLNPTFLTYLTASQYGRDYFEATGKRTTNLASTNSTKVGAFPVPLPPLPEQERIAAYLDASCAAIDAAVAAKRLQLETLNGVRESLIESAVTKGIKHKIPMRRIDEDWIGEIPAHWNVVRIKRIVSRVDYGISQSTAKEGRYPVLKMGHIESGELQLINLDFVDEVSGDLLLEQGDLLYNRTNSPDLVGKAAVFRGKKADEITFASYLVRLRTNHRVNPYFFDYLINSSGFLAFARKLAIPSVQQSNLNSTRYCRILIPLPPLDEQQEIQKLLDDKLAEVKAISSSIETQINTLIAYRKSLIHESVTGQRRISEEDVRRVCQESVPDQEQLAEVRA